jgi:hypothetical protein
MNREETPHNFIVKLSKVQKKEKILNCAREKCKPIIKGKIVKDSRIFLGRNTNEKENME